MSARHLVVALSLGLASVAFTGCEGEAEVDTETGVGEPVAVQPGETEIEMDREGVVERETEQAGEALEAAGRETGEAVEAGAQRSGEALEGAAERTGEALEETGQEIRQEANEAQ